MAKAKRAPNGSGERHSEPACGPPAAIIAALPPEALELDRPQPVGADELFMFQGDNCREI